MGGFGSGRRPQQESKASTDDHHALDIRHLQRRNLLRAGLSFSLEWKRNRQTNLAYTVIQVGADKLVLSYRHQSGGREWLDKEYEVQLAWTPCNYGGRRAWFICPANGCCRRVAILYLGRSGNFACRHCNCFAYATQRQTGERRASQCAEQLRRRLGWERGIFTGGGGKPKGMHSTTFARLQSQHDAHVRVVLDGMEKRLERLNQGLATVQKLLGKES